MSLGMERVAAREAGVPRPPSPVSRLVAAFLPPVTALLIAAVVGDLLILTFGESPAEVFSLLIEGTWGNAYGLGQVLYKATTLTFTGLSVAVALRAGLFNIGAEGQLAMGGFCAALVGLLVPAGTPAVVAIALCLAGAASGGAAVAGIPGYLKARFGASEVIVTIMVNLITLAFLNWLIATKLNVAESLHTAEINAGAIPRLSSVFEALRGSAANFVIVVALGAAAVAWWYLFRTRAGYDLRAVGLQPDAAEYGGVKVGSVWLRTMLLAGAAAGLGGTNYVLGYKQYYEEGFAAGAGFLGIAVALVGRNHPVGVVIAALLFATLSQGGLAVNAVVPKQMVDVLTAVVIIAVATSVPEVQRLLTRVRRGGDA